MLHCRPLGLDGECCPGEGEGERLGVHIFVLLCVIEA